MDINLNSTYCFLSNDESRLFAKNEQKYIFKQLTEINDLRNRIAHHEPICFKNGLTHLDITDTIRISNSIILLLQWLNVDTKNQFVNIESINSIALRAQKLIQQESQ